MKERGVGGWETVARGEKKGEGQAGMGGWGGGGGGDECQLPRSTRRFTPAPFLPH